MSISSILSSVLHPSSVAAGGASAVPTSATQVGQTANPTSASATPSSASAATGSSSSDGSVGIFDGVLKKALIGGAIGGAIGFLPFIPGGPLLGGIVGALAGAAYGMYKNFKQIKSIQAQNVSTVQQLGVQPTSTAQAQDMVQGDDTAVGQAFVGQLVQGQAGGSPTQATATPTSPTQATTTPTSATQATTTPTSATQTPASSTDPATATTSASTDTATQMPVQQVTGTGQPSATQTPSSPTSTPAAATATATAAAASGAGASSSSSGPALVTSQTADPSTDTQLQQLLAGSEAPVQLTDGSSDPTTATSTASTAQATPTSTTASTPAAPSGGGDTSLADAATLSEREKVAKIHAEVVQLQARIKADERAIGAATPAQRQQLRATITRDHKQIMTLRSQAASAAQSLSTGTTAATDPSTSAVAGAQTVQSTSSGSTASLAAPAIGPATLPDGTLPTASAAQTG